MKLCILCAALYTIGEIPVFRKERLDYTHNIKQQAKLIFPRNYMLGNFITTCHDSCNDVAHICAINDQAGRFSFRKCISLLLFVFSTFQSKDKSDCKYRLFVLIRTFLRVGDLLHSFNCLCCCCDKACLHIHAILLHVFVIHVQ